MSFRTRLISFFLLIVVIPMAAMGFLVFKLIDDSHNAKSDARADGIAGVTASVYNRASRTASLDARTVARALENTSGAGAIRARASALASQLGAVRVTVRVGGQTVADLGDSTGVAPGVAEVRGTSTSPRRVITLSRLTAADLAAQVSGSGFGIVVRQGAHTLGSSVPGVRNQALPRTGQVTVGGTTYQTVTLNVSGFGPQPVRVTVLSSVGQGGDSVTTDRVLALFFILAFLLLAAGFALLASRALQQQVNRFLEGARRLGRGDFSSPIETHGHDEFAELGDEFNKMSQTLAHRLSELEREKGRFRRSIRNIGEAFAANLDREGLLMLTLRTAIDATAADRGRVTTRKAPGEPLTEEVHIGSLRDLGERIAESEQAALEGGGLGEAWTKSHTLASVTLGPMAPGGPPHGLITVCREGRSFTQDDLELLRSLASRATLALTNINLHFTVQRQAVTDDLTGLTTHGRFQELLGSEMDEVRRYGYSVGLAMIDIDDFKGINDLYGHQQGDIVLQHVASVLGETKRDVDVACRYGGEELALILPHTDLDGAYTIAERVRQSIAKMKVPALDGIGSLQITASVGVAASCEGDKNDLISAADTALYTAKREGKNRTVKAGSHTANVFGGR
jgi:diguanylate cyclase (GGDEF)-like protein